MITRFASTAHAYASSPKRAVPTFYAPVPARLQTRASSRPQFGHEALVYSKAFLAVLSKRLQELALDVASEVSVAVAEQPQRLQEFQLEVQAVAERELRGSPTLLSSSPSGTSSSGASSSAANPPALDLPAIVDELRADIAASRALLQQIRASSSTSAR